MLDPAVLSQVPPAIVPSQQRRPLVALPQVSCDRIRHEGRLVGQLEVGSLASWLSAARQANAFFLSWRRECLSHAVLQHGGRDQPAQPAAQNPAQPAASTGQAAAQSSVQQSSNGGAAGNDGAPTGRQDGSSKTE